MYTSHGSRRLAANGELDLLFICRSVQHAWPPSYKCVKCVGEAGQITMQTVYSEQTISVATCIWVRGIYKRSRGLSNPPRVRVGFQRSFFMQQLTHFHQGPRCLIIFCLWALPAMGLPSPPDSVPHTDATAQASLSGLNGGLCFRPHILTLNDLQGKKMALPIAHSQILGSFIVLKQVIQLNSNE